MKDENRGLEDLKTRTKRFALRVVRIYGALPKSADAQVLGKQLLRSGTSVGAHYREAIRARSGALRVKQNETVPLTTIVKNEKTKRPRN